MSRWKTSELGKGKGREVLLGEVTFGWRPAGVSGFGKIEGKSTEAEGTVDAKSSGQEGTCWIQERMARTECAKSFKHSDDSQGALSPHLFGGKT